MLRIVPFLVAVVTLLLTNPFARADEIVIGHYGSLTGAEATFGKSTSEGLRLAIAEANAAGGVLGKQIKLIEYDTKGDAKEAGAMVTRLVSKDKVVAVIGEVASSLSLAGAPVCQAAGVPMISPSSTNPRVTKVGDMIFRVCFIDPFQGFAGAKFAYETRKARRVAILLDQANAYSVGLAEQFELNFKKMGGTVTSKQSYNAGDQDFTARLTTIRASDPEIIYVPGYYTDVANIAIQARALGITAPMLGGDGWDSSKLTEIGGKAIEGSFYTNHYTIDDPSETIQDFIRKYEDEYGEKPDALAALGYDAGNLLFHAMKMANTTESKALAKELAATKDFDAVTGRLTLDSDRNAVKPAVIVEIKEGQPRYVATVNP